MLINLSPHNNMFKQAILSRWFRPAGKPEEQKRGIDTDNRALLATQPSRCATLLDVLAALDINAVRILVGHLEAAKWCGPAREACKALRDAVDTGASRIQHSLGDGDYPVTAATETKIALLLLQRPCCSSVDLSLDTCPLGGNEDNDVYYDDSEEQEEEGRPEKQKEGGANDVTKCATELVTCPFRGLPPGRREQITNLKLQFFGWDRPPMLSHVLEALGPLLPGLQHLDLVHCDTRAWDWRSGEGDDEVPAVLAAAFPRLEGLTLELQDSTRLLPHLVTPMGSRLSKLVLIGTDDAKLQPPCMLRSLLPKLAALKELVFNRLSFTDYRLESSGDTLNVSEKAFVRLLNALPPALEVLHIERIELRIKDPRVEWMRGGRLEVAMQGGKACALRMGWAVRHRRSGRRRVRQERRWTRLGWAGRCCCCRAARSRTRAGCSRHWASCAGCVGRGEQAAAGRGSSRGCPRRCRRCGCRGRTSWRRYMTPTCRRWV